MREIGHRRISNVSCRDRLEEKEGEICMFGDHSPHVVCSPDAGEMEQLANTINR